MAPGFHLFPFRTEKLSPVTPMVLPRWESRSPPFFPGAAHHARLPFFLLLSSPHHHHFSHGHPSPFLPPSFPLVPSILSGYLSALSAFERTFPERIPSVKTSDHKNAQFFATKSQNDATISEDDATISRNAAKKSPRRSPFPILFSFISISATFISISTIFIHISTIYISVFQRINIIPFILYRPFSAIPNARTPLTTPHFVHPMKIPCTSAPTDCSFRSLECTWNDSIHCRWLD